MNRSLEEYLRCIINGNDTRYTAWSTDVKLFPLSYNSQITTTLGLSPYGMVFNQKPRKPVIFTANSSKNAQGYCQPTKESICYNLPLHTHDEDHFHNPQILKLASRTHIEWILNRDKKQRNLPESNKKTFTETKHEITNKFSIYSSYKFKNRNIWFNSKVYNTKRNKLQPLQKDRIK